MKRVKRYWPILLLLLVWLTLFRQFFFKGLLPIPADITVGVYYPWLDYKWGFPAGVPVKNPLLSDIPSLLYPWRSEVIDQFKSGHWPLWNPYYFMGMPLLANFQSAAFSYVNLFFVIFTKPIAWSLGVIASPILTLVLMYWLLRRKKLAVLPSLFGSITFALSGFQIAWLEYNVHGHTATMLPLLLLLIDYYFEDKKQLALWLIPLVVAMQIFTGYIPIVIYSWLVVGLYLAVFYFLKLIGKKRETPVSFTRILILGFFLLWGLILSAVQLLPGLELAALSIRKIDPLVEASNASFLPLRNLLTLFAPDIFGNPATGNYFGTAYYDNFYFFMGTLSLVLVLFSGYLIKKNALIRFWWFILLLSLVLATNNPVGQLINRLLMLSGGVAARSLYITDFSLAILAAYGANWFLTNSDFKKTLLGMLPVAMLGAGSWLYTSSIDNSLNQAVALRNLIIPGGIFLIGVCVCLLPLISKRYKIFLLLILTSCQLLYSANKYLPFSKKELLFPSTPIIDFLIKTQEQTPEPFRVELGDVVPQNMLMPYKIKTTSGYDALLPVNTAELLSLIERGKVDSRLPRVWLLKNYDSPYFPLTSTKYILTKKTDDKGIYSELGKPPTLFLNPRYKIVFEDKTVQVYEDSTYLPNVKLITRTQSNYDWNDRLALDNELVSKPIDYQLISTTITQKVIGFTLPDPVYLLLLEPFYPGWQATVDGSVVNFGLYNNLFPIIPLDNGKHTVTWEFRSLSFRNGALLTLFAAINWIAIAAYLLVTKLWQRLRKD